MDERIKIIVPVPLDVAGIANRAAQLSDAMVRPGFDIEFVAVNWGAALGDSYYDALQMEMGVFEIGLKAEESLLHWPEYGAGYTTCSSVNTKAIAAAMILMGFFMFMLPVLLIKGARQCFLSAVL